MSDGIYAALSGAIAQQRNLDVTANNVANASTTGFRADRVSFEEVLADAGAGEPNAPGQLRYVQVAKVQSDTAAGALQKTGNPLDVALQGDGFFVVDTPQGERLTRAGNFVTDADGVLRTNDGFRVFGVAGDVSSGGSEIRIPSDASEVKIAADGTIQAGDTVVGTLRIVSVENPESLEKEGLTRFLADGVALAASQAEVVQGHLETSNMNAVAGMTELITVSRSFEAFQKVIDTFQQLDNRTARELGKST